MLHTAGAVGCYCTVMCVLGDCGSTRTHYPRENQTWPVTCGSGRVG